MADSSENVPETRAKNDAVDDNEIDLPDDTKAILYAFLREQAERQEDMKAVQQGEGDTKFNAFPENWQLSQFWYNERTKRQLAGVCRQFLRPGHKLRIALLSCPSLYDQIRAVNADGVVNLFEFDERFAAYGSDYVRFDYNLAADADYLCEYDASYHVVIVDPPFLALECIEKVSHLVRRLRTADGKVVLCSGEVVAEWAEKFLSLKRCAFRPEHERNLGNEFASYANFDLDKFIQRLDDEVVE